MNRILKTGLVAGLLIAVLAFTAGCAVPAPADGGAAEGDWFAQYGMIIFLAVIFAFFWFVMIRPQRRRQKEHQNLMQGLQKGDRVVTAGGIYGTIENLNEENVVIKVESGATLRVARSSVAIMREK